MNRIDRRDRVEALRKQACKMLLYVERDSVVWRHIRSAEHSLYCARALMSAPDCPEPVKTPEVLREQAS